MLHKAAFLDKNNSIKKEKNNMCGTTTRVKRAELLQEFVICLEDYNHLLHKETIAAIVTTDGAIILQLDTESPLTEWYRFKQDDQTLVVRSKKLYSVDDVAKQMQLFCEGEERRREFINNGGE
ncbi:TPA: hypothetical protein PFD71_003277 [Vibrio cholerae]|nr:hypothetical protein TUST1-191_00220 [Vibrio phage ICP1_2006_D]ADX88317.1 hypothetical protein TUST1-182_00220 [Vibrio phage ICP1_2006_C]ADX88544.1 hypothetical protein TUST1-159_00220 [Vibrio phage ICP1_2006_B]ADX88770.1 hypothetical protein TUST1-17_00220 [Vibrio phage ICP1_2006_A]ADX88996.1 hypothetical protein TUST1-15_00220 [Vibrio phage ICP1_2005_A]ADX89228.1 hypothetical protein TUST1-2_00230 [Vibrio phage ICP1_2001_A]ADX89455.1 hypothetical protein TUST1-10_00215 [Vibrio phage ICP1